MTYCKLILSWYRSNLFERLPFVLRPQITDRQALIKSVARIDSAYAYLSLTNTCVTAFTLHVMLYSINDLSPLHVDGLIIISTVQFANTWASNS